MTWKQTLFEWKELWHYLPAVLSKHIFDTPKIHKLNLIKDKLSLRRMMLYAVTVSWNGFPYLLI